jgi:outer membrane receptor protein involved in Fe transport
LRSLGNTQLRPERSRELEGGFEATLWQGRFNLTYTRFNRTKKDAIVDVPTAPSIHGGAFQVSENVGEVQNTGTELSLNAAILASRALGWNVGMNLSNDNNVLVHLNPGQLPNYDLGLVPGYPLFGSWVLPIRAFADQNHDGKITRNEVVLGDSAIFAGQPNPKYQVNMNTDIHLLNGRLGVYATFSYQNGLTQNTQGALASTALYLAGNNPETPLSYQAAMQAATHGPTLYGLIQTVNTFRFNELSVNYELPRTTSAWLRVPRATVAIQGSNLGLHSNYRGKDPNVNAFSTVSAGEAAMDLGQIPQPRTWWLKLTLGN